MTNTLFRPTLDGLDERTLMSVTPVIAAPSEPVRVELEIVFVTSATPGGSGHAGWDLGTWSKKFTDDPQTGATSHSDIVVTKIAADVPDGSEAGSVPALSEVVVTKAESAAGFDNILTLGGIDGDTKGHEATGEETGYLTIKLKDVLVSSATDGSAHQSEMVFLGANVDGASGQPVLVTYDLKAAKRV